MDLLHLAQTFQGELELVNSGSTVLYESFEHMVTGGNTVVIQNQQQQQKPSKDKQSLSHVYYCRLGKIYRSFTALVKFIPRYFILIGAIINRTVFLISLPHSSLLVYRNATGGLPWWRSG